MTTLNKNGYEFLDETNSYEFLKLKNVENNSLSFDFPFISNEKLIKNKELISLVNKYYSSFKQGTNAFYEMLNSRNFKNIERLPIFKEKATDNVYFAHINMLNMKNVGHFLLFTQNGTKIESLSNKLDAVENDNPKISNSSVSNTLILFPSGDIYIGKAQPEKQLVAFNGILNIANGYAKRIASMENDQERNELISESNTNNLTPFNFNIMNGNTLRDNITPRGPEGIKDQRNIDIFIKDKIKEIEKVDFLEKIQNFSPFGEGILIKKDEVIYCNQWNYNPFSYQINENDDGIIIIINQNFRLEAKVYQNKIHLNNVILFDYNNESIYEGELRYNSILNNLPNNFNSSLYPNYTVSVDGSNKSNSIIDNFNNIIFKENCSFSSLFNFEKTGKGRIIFNKGEYYEGNFKANNLHGDGILLKPRSQHGNNILSPSKQDLLIAESLRRKVLENINTPETSNLDYTATCGCWSSGKLNGKGFTISNHVREKCVWRFDRLITAVISLNKKYNLHENIFDFLDNYDLKNLIYDMKNKSMLNFLKKNNCINLIKAKAFECLSYNIPENDSEIKKYLSFPYHKKSNKNSNKDLININNINSSNNKIKHLHFYNEEFYNYLIKNNNFVELFDAIFENTYEAFLPVIPVKNNGGYVSKIWHYSNAFNPAKDNNYSSNFTKAFGKDVDITAVFHPISNLSKQKVLELINKRLSFNNETINLDNEKYKDGVFISLMDKNNNINVGNSKHYLDDDNSKKNTNEKNEEEKNMEYYYKISKRYKEVRSLLIKGSASQGANNQELSHSLVKFLLTLDFNRIFSYKKSYFNEAKERLYQNEFLFNNKENYSEIINQYSDHYVYDFNNRVITDVKLYNYLTAKIPDISSFCVNKILIDIPFDCNDLNKLSMPAKTIAIFLHKRRPTTENLTSLNFDKLSDDDDNISQIINDAFLSKFRDVVDDKYQLKSLLDEMLKTTQSKNVSNMNIINIQKNSDNLFIEFDTQKNLTMENKERNSNDSDLKLLALCFLKDYKLPTMINLKPFFHFGKMVSLRLVNQNMLVSSFKPSCIDIGSITFYGEEFSFS